MRKETGKLTPLLDARAAFVKMVKEENYYSDFSKQSLKQHWNGASSGFHDFMVQNRWQDFWAGWRAAKGITEGEGRRS